MSESENTEQPSAPMVSEASGTLAGEAALLRIFIGERDMHGGRNLFEVIVEEAKQAHLAGATVFMGALGYGATSVMHRANLFRLSQDLPILIEIVDAETKIRSFMPRLQELLAGGGLVTMERVTVIQYQPHSASKEVTENV